MDEVGGLVSLTFWCVINEIALNFCHSLMTVVKKMSSFLNYLTVAHEDVGNRDLLFCFALL